MMKRNLRILLLAMVVLVLVTGCTSSNDQETVDSKENVTVEETDQKGSAVEEQAVQEDASSNAMDEKSEKSIEAYGFSDGIDENDGPGAIIGAGKDLNILYYFVIASNFNAGDEVTGKWYYNGEYVNEMALEIPYDIDRNYLHYYVNKLDGTYLPSGNYYIEIVYDGGKTLRSKEITITNTEESDARFIGIGYTNEMILDREITEADVVESYENPTEINYALIASDLRKGETLYQEWYLDDELIYENETLMRQDLPYNYITTHLDFYSDFVSGEYHVVVKYGDDTYTSEKIMVTFED